MWLAEHRFPDQNTIELELNRFGRTAWPELEVAGIDDAMIILDQNLSGAEDVTSGNNSNLIPSLTCKSS